MLVKLFPAVVIKVGASSNDWQFVNIPVRFVFVHALVGSIYATLKFVRALNIFPSNEFISISLIMTLSILGYFTMFVCPLKAGVPFGSLMSISSHPVLYPFFA